MTRSDLLRPRLGRGRSGAQSFRSWRWALSSSSWRYCWPTLDGPHARQHANEVVSVSKLRPINTLQSDCASAHPTKGFACELPPLKSLSARKDTDYDSEHFLVSGVQYGYKFAVASCQADPAQRMIHYQLTAVPVDPGKSGFRAFCTDDSGVIWSDEDGSASNCLASRRAFDR